jgi:hypothetical protein
MAVVNTHLEIWKFMQVHEQLFGPPRWLHRLERSYILFNRLVEEIAEIEYKL